MSANPCVKCGCEVRMRAMRLTVNRKRGVSHYLEHNQGFTPCDALEGFSCAMIKPYPKADSDKPWFQMIERWNAQNPVAQATAANPAAPPLDTTQASAVATADDAD